MSSGFTYHPSAIPIVLGGRTRHLLYTLGTMALLKKQHGINLFQASDDLATDPVALQAVIWAGLVHEDNTVTLDQVGAWVTLDKLAYVAETFAKAFAVANQQEVPGSPLEHLEHGVPMGQT